MATDDLIIKIGADVSDLQKKMVGITKSSQKATKGISAGFTKLRGTFNSVAGRAAKLGAVIGGAAAAFLSMKTVISTLNSADSLAKTADRMGIATEKLAGLRHAAELTGASTATLDKGLRSLTRKIQEAAQGTGEGVIALQQLGLSATELAAKSPDQAFLDVAEAMSKQNNQGKKILLTTQLMDAKSTLLINTMAGGAAGLKAMQQEAADLGIAMNRVDAAGIEGLNDSITRFKALFQGIANKVVGALAPAFEAVVAMLTEFGMGMAQTGDFTSTVTDAMATAIGVVGTAWAGLMVIIDAGKVTLGVISETMWTVVKAASQALAFWGEKAKALYDLLSAGVRSVGNVYRVVWNGILEAVGTALEGMTTMMGTAMADIGRTMAKSGVAGVATMGAAIQGLGVDMIGVGIKAKAAIGGDALAAVDDLKTSAGEAVDAFSKLTDFTMPESDTTFIDEQIAKAKQFKEESKADLTESVDNARPDEEGNSAGDRLAEDFKLRLAAIEERNAMVAEKKAEELAQVNNLEDADREMKMAKEKEFLDAAERQTADALAKNTALWKGSLQGRLSIASGILGNLATLMDGKSKKMFKIGKAAAISQAIVDTWASANKAMSTLPYPVNLVAAGATAAAGLINVQKISARKFSEGGAAGGGGGGGGSSAVSAGGDAETSAPAAPSQTFNIGLQGSQFSGSSVRGLLNQINDQLDDNAQINVRDEVQ